MKSSIVLSILGSLVLLSLPGLSQNQREMASIDSLRKELLKAKHDTTRIRLRLLVGTTTWVNRTGFWDSLVNDAHRYHLSLHECRAYAKLGYILQIQNQQDKGMACFNKSLAIAEKIGNKEAMLTPLRNIASSYLNLYDIRNGLEYAYRGLKLAEELRDKKKMAGFYSIIGSLYSYSGEKQKGIEMYFSTLKIFRELQLDGGIAETLSMLTSEFINLGDTANAIKCSRECAKYVHEFGESGFAARIYNTAGFAYIMMHKPDSAMTYLSKAYEIGKALNSADAMVSSLNLLSKSSLIKGDYKAAKGYAKTALALTGTPETKLQVGSIAQLLKEIYVKEKNFREALASLELYVLTKDSAVNENNQKLLLKKKYEYEFEKKENENKLLAQQNQIQLLQINQNRYFITGLGGLALVVTIIGFLVLRQNRLKAAQQGIQLEQKLLRSQMNPHFIFNSLQAIQNFVLKHDEKQAVKYLSSFASMTRNVLENSRMESIPLKKEIALLENYLQLQKLRFGSRFDYKIYIPESIDAENIFIPPMLAQPFIENAVEHGMHAIENGGLISIHYTITGNSLVMEIEDNGYGIDSANNSTIPHQSLATEITRERISLMNKKAREKTMFTITEAFPEQTERKGVKVKFIIPLV